MLSKLELKQEKLLIHSTFCSNPSPMERTPILLDNPIANPLQFSQYQFIRHINS